MDRHHSIQLEHHLRSDVVLLFPYVMLRNVAAPFGNARTLPRKEGAAILDSMIEMLAHCRTADTTALEAECLKARERQMQGFSLTFDEYFPSFGIDDNWGRIYQQYPEVLLHPLRAAKYFGSTNISDVEMPESLKMEQMVPSRKDRGIYYSMDERRLMLSVTRDELGSTISETIESWRPQRRFLRRWTA